MQKIEGQNFEEGTVYVQSEALGSARDEGDYTDKVQDRRRTPEEYGGRLEHDCQIGN